MNPLKYYLGKIMMWPLLPILYWQAGRIWNGMPKLPEASADLVGRIGTGNKELKVLAIGESTIAGVGVDSHRKGITGSFASFLAKQLEAVVHWTVVAKTGITAQEANELLIPKLEPRPTNLILIGLGGNDAFRQHSPNKWVTDVKQLIQNIRKIYPTTPIVFLNMPPVREFPAFTTLIRFFIGNLAELLGDELAKSSTTISKCLVFRRTNYLSSLVKSQRAKSG